MRSLARRRARLDHEEMEAVRAAVRVQVWRQVGCASMREYLERVFGYGPRAANDRLKVASALDAMPALDAALAAGELPYSAVREIARIATSRTVDEWVQACRGKCLREIEELVATRREGDLPDTPPRPELRPQVLRLELEGSDYALWRQARQVLESERDEAVADRALLAAACTALIERAAQVERTERMEEQAGERCDDELIDGGSEMSGEPCGEAPGEPYNAAPRAHVGACRLGGDGSGEPCGEASGELCGTGQRVHVGGRRLGVEPSGEPCGNESGELCGIESDEPCDASDDRRHDEQRAHVAARQGEPCGDGADEPFGDGADERRHDERRVQVGARRGDPCGVTSGEPCGVTSGEPCGVTSEPRGDGKRAHVGARRLGSDVQRGRAKYQIAIIVCEACRAGWQEGGGKRIPIRPEDVARAECDAQRIGSLDEGPQAAVQDVPPKTRRFVFRRDGDRCTVPGCRASAFIEVHHVVPREHGGGSEPENLTLLCGGHHDALHAGRLVIRGSAPNLSFEWTHEVGWSESRAHVGAETDDRARLRADAILALQTLGARKSEAAAAVDAALRDLEEPDLEQVVRAAVQHCWKS
ncbi:MAG TPA: HNH endonuclease [Gammaproteobacteria bacterium]|nr:HNH endonuclease [Gammaproteobacteria bacterium]